MRKLPELQSAGDRDISMLLYHTKHKYNYKRKIHDKLNISITSGLNYLHC